MVLREKLLRFVHSQEKSQLIVNFYIEVRVKLFRKLRQSSHPFISGDTFRSMADVKLDQVTDRSMYKAGNRMQRLLTQPNRHVKLFVDLHCTLEVENQEEIINWLRSFTLLPNQKLSIVLHNHDVVPSRNFFCAIENLSIDCYCPNVIENDFSVVPIPLGIENRYFQRNGVIRHFPKTRELTLKSVKDRNIDLFASFNINTNQKERQEAADSVMKFGHVFNQLRIHPREFRRQLAKSLFVLSPPGNGIDCHRTWEAIYFGAIPVVKRGKLAESISSDLPIHVVDEWSEVCSMNRSQLEQLYVSLIGKTDQKAYIEYWRLLINS